MKTKKEAQPPPKKRPGRPKSSKKGPKLPQPISGWDEFVLHVAKIAFEGR